jgi:putative endonuclease
MRVYYVYILKCADNTYYTGFTSDLENRIEQHQQGKYKDSYIFKRKPIELVFYCEFSNVEMAIETEKQLKKWSRIKKEALIKGEYEKLPNLAKKKFK